MLRKESCGHVGHVCHILFHIFPLGLCHSRTEGTLSRLWTGLAETDVINNLVQRSTYSAGWLIGIGCPQNVLGLHRAFLAIYYLISKQTFKLLLFFKNETFSPGEEARKYIFGFPWKPRIFRFFFCLTLLFPSTCYRQSRINSIILPKTFAFARSSLLSPKVSGFVLLPASSVSFLSICS